MDELLELLGLIPDDKKSDAQKLVDAVNGKVEKLDQKVTDQEKAKLDAIKTRDEVKTKLKAVASELGVGEIDDVSEAIEAIKSKSKGKDGDEILKKEIENLKQEVQTANSKATQTEQEYKSQLMDVMLEKDIATTLPKYKAKSNATPYIIDAIKKKAVFEDGKIAFKNDDGTTLRVNGNEATVEDVVKTMQESEKQSNESLFFNIAVESSGASGNAGGKANDGDFTP